VAEYKLLYDTQLVARGPKVLAGTVVELTDDKALSLVNRVEKIKAKAKAKAKAKTRRKSARAK
jgi:hypothetical protein|tara:strand:- start:1017 stop:1205 length:189 start_codon:yes stop_codon:yes gene_type:complete